MFRIQKFGRRSAIFASIGVISLGAASALTTTRAAHAAGTSSDAVTVINTPVQPIPVAPQGTTTVVGTVGVSGTPTVNAQQSGAWSVGTAIPVTQFSRTGTASNDLVLSGPDPSGTRYAISSVTLSNANASPFNFYLSANTGALCVGSNNEHVGPAIVLAASQTMTIPFPQPFVLSAPAGAATDCLMARIYATGSSSVIGAVLVTVVGYRL